MNSSDRQYRQYSSDRQDSFDNYGYDSNMPPIFTSDIDNLPAPTANRVVINQKTKENMEKYINRLEQGLDPNTTTPRSYPQDETPRKLFRPISSRSSSISSSRSSSISDNNEKIPNNPTEAQRIYFQKSTIEHIKKKKRINYLKIFVIVIVVILGILLILEYFNEINIGFFPDKNTNKTSSFINTCISAIR
jgi:hypothetical protein